MFGQVILTFLHILVILWALVAPFSSVSNLRVSYIVLMPFIMFHWILLDNTCIFTMIENKLRGCETEESFIHRLVSPIYNIPEGLLGNVMWLYAIVSWLYAVNATTLDELKENMTLW